MTPLFGNALKLRKDFRYVLGIVLFLLGGITAPVYGVGWDAAVINSLPDASFASLESDETGKFRRHCPYRNEKGEIDNEQLIFVLGTLSEESWQDQHQKEIAMEQLKRHYNLFLSEAPKDILDKPFNINVAPLTLLVMLPRIGPVLAVKIALYREKTGPFTSIQEIKKVGGIGEATFNAIRYYIRTD
jgi:competence ComEA-like helix-hairpin-helix protein